MAIVMIKDTFGLEDYPSASGNHWHKCKKDYIQSQIADDTARFEALGTYSEAIAEEFEIQEIQASAQEKEQATKIIRVEVQEIQIPPLNEIEKVIQYWIYH